MKKNSKRSAEENAYILALDNRNAYSSGNVVSVKSFTDADINFTYINCAPTDYGHVLIRDGGMVGNAEVIHSMNAFYSEFEGSLQVSISYDQVYWSDYQDIESGYSYNLGALPYFIQLKANGEDTVLKELDIGYACEINEDAEPQHVYGYQKITKKADFTSGQYLIGFDYDDGEDEPFAVVFKGSLTSPDVNQNYITPDLEDDIIYSTEAVDACAVTIDVSNKSIKCSTGKYIGAASNKSDVLSTKTTAFSHTTLTLNNDGSLNAVCNKLTFSFALTSSSQRFRYFKSPTTSSYEKVYLYKLVDLGLEAKFTRIAAIERNINSFKTYESYNKNSDLLVTIFDENNVEYLLPESYFSLFIYDSNGNYISPSSPFETAGTYTAIVAFGNFAPVTYTFEVREGSPIVKSDWTIMLYICGSDLESGNGLASLDIDEILSVRNQPDDVNIVIETGGSSKWTNRNISPNYIQRWHVDNGTLVQDSSLNYTSMSGASTLEDFIEYGIEEYPAEKTGFIFWNHGGAMEGVCYDEVMSDGNQYEGLTTYEVDSAFSTAFKNTGFEDKFEFIGYDACLMQIQEAALFNAKYAKYMIGSQESESGYGWDYDTWIDDVYAGKSTLEFLKACVDGFIAENGGTSTSNDQTLSILDLSTMDDYYAAWEALASKLTNIITSSSAWTTFKGVVNKAMKFGYDSNAYSFNSGYRFDIFDVGTFITAMSGNTTYSSCATQLSNLQTALNSLVVYKKNGGGAAKASGLCFFCPIGGYEEKAYATSLYNGFTTWCSLIYKYGKFYS